MKRYWKIISICLVTLLVIGTFYIQSSFATGKPLKIEFEKVNGSEDELQNIMLYGYFSQNHSQLNQPFEIKNEGTIDPTNLSLFQKLSRAGTPNLLEDLVAEHKNFMRSKDLNPKYFFEDENIVAYTIIKNLNKRAMKDINFEIEVLNKKIDKITSIQLDVPDKEDYGWMDVEVVQVINDELKVITRGSSQNGRQHELRVYTIDMKRQEITSDDVIASIPEVENGWSDLSILNDTYSLQRHKYFLIISETYEDEREYSDGESNLVASELIVYDMENNQSRKIITSDRIFGSIVSSSAIYNSTILIPSQTANGVEVSQYDIENDKWGETLSFDLSDTKANEGESYTKLLNGKLFTIHATTSGHTIVIGDLKTGKSLYEGKLKVTYQGEGQKYYRLYFHEIEYVH